MEGGRFSGNPVSGADSECNEAEAQVAEDVAPLAAHCTLQPWKQDCPKICVLQDGRGAPELYSRS